MIPYNALGKGAEPAAEGEPKSEEINERDIDELEASQQDSPSIEEEDSDSQSDDSPNRRRKEREKESNCKRKVPNYDYFFRNSEYFRKKTREEIINRIRHHASQRSTFVKRENQAKNSLEKQIDDLDKAILEDSIRKEELEKRLDQNKTLRSTLKNIHENM
ncbi:unnamed protein product [Dimorphilus gyrociliatus]|uniref:Uncharacterized protein n=1 Tax=Dimorphilus gyrociliatus TaxID=2664684 RepID=A0A7I8V5P7_9ANNE|nr:unnamed protein product [Dimorphilus gyrociliatus]